MVLLLTVAFAGCSSSGSESTDTAERACEGIVNPSGNGGYGFSELPIATARSVYARSEGVDTFLSGVDSGTIVTCTSLFSSGCSEEQPNAYLVTPDGSETFALPCSARDGARPPLPTVP